MDQLTEKKKRKKKGTVMDAVANDQWVKRLVRLRWKSICEMQMYSDSCLIITITILEKGNKVLCRK